MPSLEVLLKGQRWDEARNKLKRYKYKGVDDQCTELIFSGEDIPDDILEVLFSLCIKKNQQLGRIVKFYKFRAGCRDTWSVSYLERLLRVLLKTTKEPTHNPRTCIQFLANACPKESICGVSSIDDLTSSLENGSKVGIFWRKFELLIRASIRGGLADPLDKPLDEIPLLATMIELNVPKFFIWLVLKLWPEQAKIPDGTEYGRLPLHWAAIVNNKNTENSDHTPYTGRFQEELERQSLIDMLMKVYPEGAAVTDKKNGSYPLELLLDQDYYTNWQHCGSEWTKRNVMQLARQNPENLVRICPINKLMPFMTAASCCNRNYRNHGDDDDTDDDTDDDNDVDDNDYDDYDDRKRMIMEKLNLSYSLLMENPNAVLSGITSTDREAWLTDKLDKAQKHIQLIEAENRELKRQLLQQQQRQNNPSSVLVPVPTSTTTATATTTSSFQIYTNIGEGDLPPKKRKLSAMDRRKADEDSYL